jgi:PAS domain S-box-containing protein
MLVTPRDVRIIGDWFAAVAESALAAENRRFADMLDTIPDHLMLHNADGFLIYVNRATGEVAKWAAGLSPEEVLGRRVIDFVRDKAFGRMVDENIKRVLAGELITEEFVLPHPAGGRWNEHHVLPLHGPDGKIEAIATASRDIHARKKAEARLQILSKLSTLAEMMDHDRMVDAIAHVRWIYNTRLDALDTELVGKTASEIVGAEMGEALDDLQRRVLETGEGARATVTATDDGGKRRHLLVRYEPLRGSNGIEGLSGSTVDVTELKEAEEQVARELAFRERMMGIVGHDLRNPISAILSVTSLMLGGEQTEKARKQLGFVEQAARRMNEMIGTLLDFTRLRFHGSLPIAVVRIGLDQLAREVVAELQAAYPGREIELSISGNLRGEWDPGRLAQLFTNLVANALTHGERGSPVWIAVTGDNDDVVLSVRNRGETISPAVAERLFEPFKPGDDSEGGPRRGLGLGLFIVREIARAHGGTVGVQSGEGHVMFTATLPRSAATRRTPGAVS